MTETLIYPHDLAAIRKLEKMEILHPSVEEMLSVLEAGGQLRTLAGVRAAVATQPIAADCLTNYKAHSTSGRRPLSQIKWIVMHATQGFTAQSAAAWFQNPESRGSAHLCVDNNYCFRTLEDDQIPWGAQGTNYGGFHIEQAGFVSWSSYFWSNQKRATLNRAAFKTAHRCRLYGLPVRFVDAAGLRLGVEGITTHAEATKAFGGDHSDPGVGWPRTLFMTSVRAYYASLTNVRRVA